MRDCRFDLAVNLYAPIANRNDHSKGSLYEELQQAFHHFRMYHIHILLGCYKTKFGREDKFMPTAGKDHKVCIHQTLEKK
jgi:hypothetical protein